jgi:hypothetical protein
MCHRFQIHFTMPEVSRMNWVEMKQMFCDDCNHYVQEFWSGGFALGSIVYYCMCEEEEE